ncbi:hypothetical protein CYMTET_7160 [Cymbomonas tetramitiformis]|uniref:Uncharacterized protein n=1 Tax=Cymbomonas tetramitiformis TaxID=36881 RepID=A0AAE0GW66_9CHLO|nr:hypothetical protein CYMTET_7160 [Cymbomonas tetramitiformis]
MSEDLSLNVTSASLSNISVPTDVAYNHYGNRMATVSSEGIVVWGKGGAEEWTYTSLIQVPDGHRCLKLAWAHPEFGSVLAAGIQQLAGGSSVHIWQERDFPGSPDESSWQLRARFDEACGPVVDLRFSPADKGLWLVAAGGDGAIRLYSCLGTLELETWQMQSAFQVQHQAAPTCVQWRLSDHHQPLLAVATHPSPHVTKAQAGVHLWLYEEAFLKWSMAGSLLDTQCVDWIAWAPMSTPMGDLLAATSGLEVVLSSIRVSRGVDSSSVPAAHIKEEARLVHTSKVVQAEWNMSATTLATSCENGAVCLWSQNLESGEWLRVATVNDGNA